ncbi:G2/M phase-specific E3 ubiquitin-protein ligase [Acipenser ruthenus]|uniref:G2/M phase-specific E3 ubiquitin-protein ligase n=1 Tax=Acipenser ruthenus TaxID=7906 RepID=A0A444UBT6_ACIRT|nr:G2/M phase-specific E3 ubiquitin-protein ligase [Acipenser ruthenus]
MSQNSRSSSRLSEKRFEILMGLHNKVVKPNLVAGQTLSGFLIHKVFASKALYLRPNTMLLQMPHDDTNKITNAYASDLQDESQKPHCEVHHQYINILDLTQDDNSESAILLDDNLIEPSHDGFLLEDILGNLAKAINDEEIRIFNINRSTVWEGALRGFRRNTYSPTKRISVKVTDDVGHSEEEETGVSLGEILAFATGTDYPPALGLETKPSIEFIYSSDLFPTANTCANVLRLPTVHKEYEDFKKNMDFAIQNSPGFGQAKKTHE